MNPVARHSRSPAAHVISTDLSWLTLATGLRRGGRGMLAQMQPWVPKA
ncbi:hypothetical protein EMIT0232MI5_30243 [Pseudomonas sp. IT-232MI5]|nr:hypothetical protein [Pseudomonas sp. Irchel 3H7]